MNLYALESLDIVCDKNGLHTAKYLIKKQQQLYYHNHLIHDPQSQLIMVNKKN